MKIPSPLDCGLPEKIASWRPDQEQAVDVMITSKYRVTGLSAPTGFGKSPAYVAFALLSKKPTCIVTNSRGLQDQLMKDYGPIGMVDIRGRSNYSCVLREDYTCREGYAMGCPYKGSVMCPSSQAEMRTRAAMLCVTNYDKWISTGRNSSESPFLHFEQVVFDEGHDAPDALAGAMQFTLSHDTITQELKLPYPLTTDLYPCWKVWSANARLVAEERMLSVQAQMMDEVNPRVSQIRKYLHFKELTRRLGILATGHPENWVVDEIPSGYQFDPIWPGRYAEGVLFLRVPRIIIVSATLRPKTLNMLGVSKVSYDFKEFPSSFDRGRCPIYYIPTMRVDVRAGDLSPLWVRLDQIMSRRRDRKGVIHTISFARRDIIMGHSRFAGSMITNQRGELATGTVELFKASGPGTTLIGPSFSTGYDFPMKDCEWQFICKIPFPDGRSKILQARQERDREYGPYLAMQSMVQSFGRGMRSQDDRCENFIGDDHLAWFLPKYGHLAPKSFHGFFRRVETVPVPLDKL